MTLGQLFLVFWARKWVVIGMVIFGAAVGIAIGFIFSPRYRAETQVVVDFKSMDPVSGMMVLPQATPGYLSTQFDIIQSHRVALRVVQKLRLADNPFAKQLLNLCSGVLLCHQKSIVARERMREAGDRAELGTERPLARRERVARSAGWGGIKYAPFRMKPFS